MTGTVPLVVQYVASHPEHPAGVLVPIATREGARRSILDSAGRMISRTGRATFTLAAVIDDLRAHGIDCTDQTIRTVLGAHLYSGTSKRLRASEPVFTADVT